MSDKQKQMARGLSSSLVRETEVSAFAVENSTLAEAEDASPVLLRQPLTGWVEGGLAILDAKGRVIEVNETLSRWLDRSSDSIVGQ